MESEDLTIEILKSIRDELKTTRTELSKRLDQTNERLMALEVKQTETNERLMALEVKQTETNERLDRHEQALGRLIGEMQGLNNRIDNILTGPLGEKVKELDRRVAALEARAEV